MKRISLPVLLPILFLGVSLSVLSADVVDNDLGRKIKAIFPELASGYIDLNNNGSMDRLDDMDEMVPDSRVKDGILQVQEILDFISENYPFFMIDDLVSVRESLESAQGTIPELIGLNYSRTMADVIRKKEALGIEGIYLSPSAKKEAFQRMSELVGTMVTAYNSETARDEASYIEARNELFTMIEQGYPVVDTLSDEDNAVLVTSLIHTILNERSGNPKRVKSAVKTLGKLGDPFAVPYIMDLMNDEEFAPECIRALGEIGNPEAEQMLITLIQEESGIRIREAALKALGRIGGEESINLLVSLLPEVKGSSPREETAILHALSGLAISGSKDRRISSLLTEYINSEDSDMRVRAAKGLAASPSTASIALLTNALNNEKDNEVRMELVRSVASIGTTQVVNVMIGLLRDPSAGEELKEVVIRELGSISEGIRAVTIVQGFLGDENDGLRSAARDNLLALYSVDPKTIAGTLNRMALTSDEELVQVETADLLSRMANPDTISGLMNLLKSPSGEVKKYATWAIYTIGDVSNVRMINDLVQIVTSETEPLEVRINAVRALGLSASPGKEVIQTLDTVVKMRGEKYSMLRYFAVQALGRLRVRDPEIVQTLSRVALREKDPLLTKEILRTLRKAAAGDDAVTGTLVSLFRRQEDPEIRTLIVEALGDMKRAETAEQAETLLSQRPGSELKRRILYACASADTEKAINLIITNAADEDVSELALALLQDRAPRTMQPLVEERLRSETDSAVMTLLEDLKTAYETRY